MAALKIFLQLVTMETLLSPETFILAWSRVRCTSFPPHLPDFSAVSVDIYSFLFVPVSRSHATSHLIRSALKSSRPQFHFSLQSV